MTIRLRELGPDDMNRRVVFIDDHSRVIVGRLRWKARSGLIAVLIEDSNSVILVPPNKLSFLDR